ncbi:unnamed protein product [Acanthoscelides obtectus]|uniref:Uncharacterized protein n=1 Tax=Acanthoscelides obtectus TaxID=200917 RepID=A0A9P0LIU5_ACAOB|nr:unnamed protein product [Acanthoscelides obtectus]CAK1680619.1 hypothetical protein AOBTE_LOCUS32808 [Acanthoscelides obtectus]
MGPSCKDKCRFQCSKKVHQIEHEGIFKQFWSPSKTINVKRKFVPPNKISAEVKDTIRDHILKFPTVVSLH